jgi:adenylyltransferase/sulfurtransferase
MDIFLKDPITHTQNVISPTNPSNQADIYFLCRRGNDSLVSALALRRALDEVDPENARGWRIRDVIGGVRAWSRDVDPGFPVY